MTKTISSEISAAAPDEIAALAPWFHNLHLPDGRQTCPRHPLGDFPVFKWQQIAPHLPEDLSGWTVLDIGCNAGFYSFALACRGADVLAIDSNPHYLRQARWAQRQFGPHSSIDFRQAQVYHLSRLLQTFDLVLFMGVFYHLRYPQLALDLVAQKVRRLLVFQTLTMPGDEVYLPEVDCLGVNRNLDLMRQPGWPKMAFVEHRLDNDPTNWWIPNHAGVEAMLRSSGLRIASRPGHEIYLCEPDPNHPACVATWNEEELQAAVGLR
jgi:tRNA (mo5U34)-methyltransferase